MALKTSYRRTFASFDKRSVLLFAALSLGGAAALHAQQAPAGTAPAASTSPSSSPAFGPGAAPRSASQSSENSLNAPIAASQAAFDRADANRDGQLSAQEADTLPAMGNRFMELDADKNGMLSREEFNEGAKP